MPASRSSYADGIRLAVGFLAAALALIECVAVIVLAGRPAIVTALGISEGMTVWVTIGAVTAMVLIIAAVVVGVAPRRYSSARSAAENA